GPCCSRQARPQDWGPRACTPRWRRSARRAPPPSSPPRRPWRWRARGGCSANPWWPVSSSAGRSSSWRWCSPRARARRGRGPKRRRRRAALLLRTRSLLGRLLRWIFRCHAELEAPLRRQAAQLLEPVRALEHGRHGHLLDLDPALGHVRLPAANNDHRAAVADRCEYLLVKERGVVEAVGAVGRRLAHRVDEAIASWH